MTDRLTWTVTSSEITFQDRWLTVRSDWCLTPRGDRIGPYHVVRYPNWINVVAVTRDGELVLAREYRHGAGQVVLGLPSGAIDAADGVEAEGAALRAANRELMEETGYAAGRLERILGAWPNPANQDNRATSFLALDLVAGGETKPDLGEEIEVELHGFAKVLRDLASGELDMQAMHIAALWAAARRILVLGEVSGLASETRREIAAALTGV